ncbi:Uncharacterised protein [Mycobacteroides abscessus]|nr:Uncharacterised protein [Mycobacteroides abscessus]
MRASISATRAHAKMPSLPRIQPRIVRPPDDSPPSTAPISAMPAVTCLNPTLTSRDSSPKCAASRSSRCVVARLRTTPPFSPRTSCRYQYRRRSRSFVEMYSPVSSTIPIRSESPSVAMPRS